MRPLFAALRELGARITPDRSGTLLPFELLGPIHGGSVALKVEKSSQFTSALLLALPKVRPDSTIHVVGTPVSEPYVQATLAVLRRHGVHVRAGSHGYRISGGQRLRRVDAAVPGDASSAAYLWAAAALTGGRVQVRGVPSSWPQADLAILALLRRYGAEVSRRGDAVTVEGGRRRPLRCTLTDSPDLYPLVGVLAAAAPGRSYLLGAEHVAAKESDRKQETMRLVRAMGARVEKIRGGLVVEGTAQTRPLRLRGVVDHRIVMSAAVGALLAPNPSELSDAGSVGKSFPGFFDALGQLGAEVSVR